MPTLPFEAWPFCGPSYLAANVTVETQRSINLFPEKAMAPGAKTPVALIGRPGLTLLGTLATSPVRALIAGNGRLFAVGGTHVYEVNPTTGATITDFGAMAGSSGTGPARFCFVGTGSSAQLLVMDSTAQDIFYVNPVGPAVTKVFDGFSFDYLDGYLFALSGLTENKLCQSALLDGTTWPALSFAVITGTSDFKRRVLQANGLLWIFGQQNIEVWYNVGTTPFTLARMDNGTINVGIAGNASYVESFTACRVMNTVLWWGAGERGYGRAWRADGLIPVQISPPGIESLVESYGAGALNGAYSWAEEYDGHAFWVTNFPNAGSYGATLAYDMATGFWHERTYNDSGTEKMALPSCFASLQNGSLQSNYVGDRSSGKIYLQSMSYAQDNGVDILYTRTAPHVTNSNRWLKHQSVTLDAYVGTATPTLEWSNDGGQNFNTPRSFQEIGTAAASGIRTLKSWTLGRGRDRVYRVKVTGGSNLVRISNAWLSVEPGTEP